MARPWSEALGIHWFQGFLSHLHITLHTAISYMWLQYWKCRVPRKFRWCIICSTWESAVALYTVITRLIDVCDMRLGLETLKLAWSEALSITGFGTKWCNGQEVTNLTMTNHEVSNRYGTTCSPLIIPPETLVRSTRKIKHFGNQWLPLHEWIMNDTSEGYT